MPNPTPPPTGTTMLEACKGYIDAVEKYTACTSVPQAARDAARQGLDAMKQGFAAQPNPAPEAVAASKQACEMAAAALVDGMKQFACP